MLTGGYMQPTMAPITPCRGTCADRCEAVPAVRPSAGQQVQLARSSPLRPAALGHTSIKPLNVDPGPEANSGGSMLAAADVGDDTDTWVVEYHAKVMGQGGGG